MAVLSAVHKKQLRKILEQHAQLDTVLHRRIFLEDAGLVWLASQFTSNTDAHAFCYEVVMLCENAGAPPTLGEDAIIHLLRFVRDDIVVGHDDKIAQIEEMLAAHQPRPVTSPRATPLSDGTGYSDPERLWQELLDAEEDKDWDTVIRIGERFREATYKIRDTRQKLANAYNNSGRAYHHRGEYDQAIIDKSKAIALDSRNAKYYCSRGVSYHDAAYHKHPVGDYARAIADSSHAIELDSTNAVYYDSRATSYYTAAYHKHPVGDYTKAIADSSSAIELDPHNAEYYYSRGTSYQIAAYEKHPAGDYTKAIADYSRAIALDPSNEHYFYTRGVTYKAMRNEKAAQADFDKAKALGYKEK